MNLNSLSFRVNEIFYSLQGEGTLAGKPCVFVRLAYCNLRCKWCDTPYAQTYDESIQMSGTELIQKIKSFNCNFIEFTGGEPLLQKDVFPLIALLCDCSYFVAVETNGSCDISQLHRSVKRVIDIKTPSSSEEKSFNTLNIKYLSHNDDIKFVIAEKNDFEFAINLINQHQLHKKAGEILFSPAFNILEPALLAEWILNTTVPIRLSLQLHKYIWNPNERCR